MEGATDRDLIIAAVQLGARLGRQEVIGTLLGKYGLSLTRDMVDRLADRHLGLEMSGYERFVPITNLEVPSGIHAKLLDHNPRILIVAQLVELTAEELMERYELTAEEVELVRAAFAFGSWQLRPSLPQPPAPN